MPSLRDIKRRIRSNKNTAQITKAMELVAASRMRRAQQRVVASRPYAEAMRTMIAEVGAQIAGAGQGLHPLLAEPSSQDVGVMLITPDRGLTGPLNTNIIRRGTEFILEQESENKAVSVVTVGRRGQDFLLRRGRTLLGTFTGIVDKATYNDVIPMARVVVDAFTSGTVGHVYLVFPRFISTLTQRPEVVRLLPIAQSREAIEQAASQPRQEYIFEPDPAAILGDLLPRYVEVQIYQALLETAASEQSARMVAMRNATENAKDLVSSLTLTYNKVRQANITREVTEIASAAEAMATTR